METSRRPVRPGFGPLFAMLFSAALPLPAAEVAIDQDASLFAVVTHKGGLAKGKAHNHLIAATGYRATLAFDPANLSDARFELELAAEDLAADPPDLQAAWYPRLRELGVLDEPFGDVSDKDRAKVHEAMLGKEQLDAAAFPRLSARLVSVAADESTAGEVAFDHQVILALEVHGRTVEKPVKARYELDGGALVVEALGSFRFSDFGIEPYSAAFGLVKNLDEFHLYLHLEGEIPAE